MGCIWRVFDTGNNYITYRQEFISGQSIDFNKKNEIEKNVKVDFYFGIRRPNGDMYRDSKIKRTINEWEHLIYKPEENSMVVENITEGNYVDIYSILSEDIPNKYEVDGGTRYNENDGKFYYEIRLMNDGKSSTIADISTNSDELKFNLKNLKVELPKHTNEAFSEVKVYIYLLRKTWKK